LAEFGIVAEDAGEVRDGSEDAAGDNFEFYSGEPQFDLTQPVGILGCEVEATLKMLRLELP